jgi:hypothetical protein
MVNSINNNKFIDNIGSFQHVFGSSIEKMLNNVIMLGYSIDRTSSDVNIGFDMLNYPKNPQEEWINGNMTYLKMCFKNTKK